MFLFWFTWSISGKKSFCRPSGFFCVTVLIFSPGFGNARDVENFLDRILSRQAERLRQESEKGTIQNVFLLRKEDIIGPSPALALPGSKAWAELQGMIGLGKVKEAIRSLADLLETNYALEMQGKETRDVALNRLFLGNPGTGFSVFPPAPPPSHFPTGKTTVAV